ncbi:MAG: hypothetical protein JST79_21345 [Acidobacteria bacterium]|jgi:hypothetical protein|nr:hypothetical protein [Acidobacteriota bacterium]
MKNRPGLRCLLAAALMMTLLPWIACTPNVKGKYRDSDGLMTVELKSGGEGQATFMGQSSPCTYEVKSKEVHLTCNYTTTVFTILDDGSLGTPPMVGLTLKKVE